MATRGQQIMLFLLLGLGIVGGRLVLGRPEPEPLVLQEATAVPTATVAPTATPAPVVVFVSGAVNAPGVYTLPPGNRVVDALSAAGGPTADAEFERVNQATLLSDGMQIHLAEQGETEEPPPLVPATTPASTGAASPGDEPPDGLINLNHADAALLESLPGVGPVLAERIVAYREDHGPFTSTEQLVEVNGIGPATLEEVREYVVVE